MTLDNPFLTRRRLLGLIAALTLMALPACAVEPGEGAESDEPTDPPGPSNPDGPGVQTAADDPAAGAYQAGATGFALSMLAAAVGAVDGNAVISPLSISQCLALIGQGAGGATLQQLAGAFGCADAEQLRSGANAELTAIAALSHATFDMANTAFTDESFAVKPEFSTTVAEWFGVATHATDFADPATATEQINGWVAARTNDKIPDLLEPGLVTVDTRTVLVNALYLKALWASQFNPNYTFDDDFTRDDGTIVDASYMHDSREVPVAQSDGAMLFELPYADGELAALFYLPAEGTALGDAVAGLQPNALLSLIEQLQTTDAALTIPLFEVRQRLELSDALKSLGIHDAFDDQKADFTALADEPTHVSFVQHEAWLKVGEKGTEGAAATAGGMDVTSVGPEQEPLQIVLDRPFLFAVRVRSTGSIAFVAAVQDPSQE